MSITFYCRQREDYPTFNQAYFRSFQIDSNTGGPWHEAFAPLVEHDFATMPVTIEEDEDTKELSSLLDHYAFAIRPFVEPQTSLFDFNAGNKIHGWTEWYKFQYRVIMQPAQAMKERLYEGERSNTSGRGGKEPSLATKVRNKSMALTSAETQILAKLVLIQRIRVGFMWIHRALEIYKASCSTKSRIGLSWVKDLLTGTNTSALLLKPGYSPTRFDYLDLPRLHVDRIQVESIVSVLQHEVQTTDSLAEVSLSSESSNSLSDESSDRSSTHQREIVDLPDSNKQLDETALSNVLRSPQHLDNVN